MQASSLQSFIALAATLAILAVSANPAIERSESPLDTWVSVDASGSPVATITPALTTIDGAATTISANPGAFATTSRELDPTATSSAATATSTGGGSFPVCDNKDGELAPFCLPNNGSSVYVGETYYVTWDINSLAEMNASVLVMGNYVNAPDGRPQAFQSPTIPSRRGFYALTIERDWLQGHSWNNITLFLYPSNPSADESQSLTGPTVMVTNRPPTYYRQPKTPAPKGQTLYIALPVVFGALILLICGTHIWNRKKRRIGLGNAMGRRKGYVTGKSRAERLGRREIKGAAIQLREQKLAPDGQYRDVPEDRHTKAAGRLRMESESVGSLAGYLTEERPNYFRDEIRRQEQARR